MARPPKRGRRVSIRGRRVADQREQTPQRRPNTTRDSTRDLRGNATVEKDVVGSKSLFGIQAPKLETRINWNFQFATLSPQLQGQIDFLRLLQVCGTSDIDNMYQWRARDLRQTPWLAISVPPGATFELAGYGRELAAWKHGHLCLRRTSTCSIGRG